jgi:hypothetical protein
MKIKLKKLVLILYGLTVSFILVFFTPWDCCVVCNDGDKSLATKSFFGQFSPLWKIPGEWHDYSSVMASGVNLSILFIMLISITSFYLSLFLSSEVVIDYFDKMKKPK